MAHQTDAISVEDIHKSFGTTDVLKGISFKVKQGSILALLGPNGAGKTTTIRILSTLIKADSGKATIAGYDVREEADQVRAHLGLTGQFAAVDEYLTGEENIEMIGKLYHLPTDHIKKRTALLLKQLDLVDASKRPARTYSGGMKRRLDLAMSLVAEPPVIFLDEPTTGLDPRSRLTLWKMIKELAQGGTTILLTTQYMEEADYLADSIMVIDNGAVIAEGTANELKKKVGADRVELVFANDSDLNAAAKVLNAKDAERDVETKTISLPTTDGPEAVRQVLDTLKAKKIAVEGVSLRRPTLDDVFLTLTGHGTEKIEADAKKKEKKHASK